MIWILYKFTSPSGKCYIGQTCGTLEKRWARHLSTWRRGKGRSKLCYAFSKYDPESWIREVLVVVGTQDDANEMEERLIAAYGTIARGYNIRSGGKSSSGYRLSKEHRAAISNGRRGKVFGPLSKEHRRKIGQAQIGMKRNWKSKTLSESHKIAIRDGMTGTKREYRPLSEAHRAAIAAAATGKKRGPYKKKVHS